MCVSVISQVYQSNRSELLALRKRAVRGGRKAVDREAWEAAEVASSIDDSDRDINERLFTLYDKRGNNEVQAKEFLAGLATIVNATLEERLHMAFELCDDKGTGFLTQPEVMSALISMSAGRRDHEPPLPRRAPWGGSLGARRGGRGGKFHREARRRGGAREPRHRPRVRLLWG